VTAERLAWSSPEKNRPVWESEHVPAEIIDSLGQGLDHDYNLLMHFFCNEWPGRNGDLKGCMVRALPENGDAVNVFNFVGGGDFRNMDIESAIRMMGIGNHTETFMKVRILADEFLKGRKK